MICVNSFSLSFLWICLFYGLCHTFFLHHLDLSFVLFPISIHAMRMGADCYCSRWIAMMIEDGLIAFDDLIDDSLMTVINWTL